MLDLPRWSSELLLLSILFLILFFYIVFWEISLTLYYDCSIGFPLFYIYYSFSLSYLYLTFSSHLVAILEWQAVVFGRPPDDRIWVSVPGTVCLLWAALVSSLGRAAGVLRVREGGQRPVPSTVPEGAGVPVRAGGAAA